MTVNYSLTGKLGHDATDDDDFRFVSVDVGIQNQPTLNLLQYYRLSTIARHNVRRSGGTIVEVAAEVKGSVCLCHFDSWRDAHDVQRVATQQGAVGMITFHEHMYPTAAMPVFTLARARFNEIATYAMASVKFEPRKQIQVHDVADRPEEVRSSNQADDEAPVQATQSKVQGSSPLVPGHADTDNSDADLTFPEEQNTQSKHVAATAVQVWRRQRWAELAELDQGASKSDLTRKNSNVDESVLERVDDVTAAEHLVDDKSLNQLDGEAPIETLDSETVDAVNNPTGDQSKAHIFLKDDTIDHNEPKYGSRHGEIQLREWLDRYKVHCSVTHRLVGLGFRSIDDVGMLADYPEAIETFPFLDRKKIEKAIASLNR